MIGTKTWIALFSGNGKQLLNLSKGPRGITPDVLATNTNPGAYDIEILDLDSSFVGTNASLDAEDYIQLFGDAENCLITLHNWDLPIPESIRQAYEIYDSQWGIPSLYKGTPVSIFEALKDSLERNNTIPRIGSFISRNETPIICCSTTNNPRDLDHIKSIHSATSLQAWLIFLAYYDTYNTSDNIVPEIEMKGLEV